MSRITPLWPVAVSRRRFLTTTAAAGSLAALTSSTFGAAFLGQADLILSGGTFHTMDPTLGPVEALAVRGDRILAVGSVEDIAALAGAGTERIDTRGLTVTPGFIDAHSHPLMANEAVSVNVDLRSIPEVQEALRAKAAATPRRAHRHGQFAGLRSGRRHPGDPRPRGWQVLPRGG